MEEITENEVILFADAVHPQHNTRSSYAWIKKGQDKLIPSKHGRRRIIINGAMNAHHPEEVIIHEAEATITEATIALNKIQQRYADKERIYVIGDNARYYRKYSITGLADGKSAHYPSFLPPLFPNLNPY
ncbi:MAG: transposase [Lewinellaceae bacterium]|nr:transposase [Lewinellaceae bacterium]